MKSGWAGFLMTMLLVSGNAGAEPGDPAAPAPAAAEARPPVVIPAAVERPKPVERPAPARPVAEPPKPAPVTVRPPEPAPAEPAATTVVTESSGSTGWVAYWLTGFAMLLIGFAAGFVTRHLVSRRKLGGMTVRIGTWRGIP